MVTKRERVVGINPEFGISRCTLLYIKQIKKDLLYSTGNYIQYLEMSYDGKESKNHLYLHLNHVAVHLKHCSSTILQFFKKCKKKKRWWSASTTEVSLSGRLLASIRVSSVSSFQIRIFIQPSSSAYYESTLFHEGITYVCVKWAAE